MDSCYPQAGGHGRFHLRQFHAGGLGFGDGKRKGGQENRRPGKDEQTERCVAHKDADVEQADPQALGCVF